MDVDGLPVGPVHQLALGVSFQAAGPGKPFGPHLKLLACAFRYHVTSFIPRERNEQQSVSEHKIAGKGASKMKIGSIMSRKVRLISPAGTLRQAAALMKQSDTGVLPVAQDDKLVGMITDRDITIRGIGRGKGPNAKVRDVMTQEVRYCFEDEDAEHVAQNMAELQVRRLPVMNHQKRLVGIVSLADLATEGSLPKTARALHGISQRGGQHNQAA